MKNIKRLLAIIVLATMLITLFAGCGAQGTPAASD